MMSCTITNVFVEYGRAGDASVPAKNVTDPDAIGATITCMHWPDGARTGEKLRLFFTKTELEQRIPNDRLADDLDDIDIAISLEDEFADALANMAKEHIESTIDERRCA